MAGGISFCLPAEYLEGRGRKFVGLVLKCRRSS